MIYNKLNNEQLTQYIRQTIGDHEAIAILAGRLSTSDYVIEKMCQRPLKVETISLYEFHKIMAEPRERIGCFWCPDTNKTTGCAIDNRVGEAWAESFDSMEDATKWLHRELIFS